MNAQTKTQSKPSKKITIKRGAKRISAAPKPPPLAPAAPKPETLEEIIARVTAKSERLYKVLVSGHGTHTSMPWNKPTADAPGAWHEVDGELRLCENGLHVTSYAAAWWKPECEVYLAEVGDERVGDHKEGRDRKCAARRVRLLRLATKAELAENGIFDGGTHDTREGQSFAFNSAQVTASGSAQVTAYDSAQVTASGSAKVTAYDSAQVTAYDSAKVTASGSAKVTASDSAQVTASGSAQVTAFNSAQVTAFNSAQVTASGSAKVTADQHCVVMVQVSYYNKPTIKLMGHAVAISYEWGSAPTVRCASQATLVLPGPAADSANDTQSGKAA